MVKQTRFGVGNCRLKESVALAFFQYWPLKKRYHLIKHSDVAGCLNIVRSDINKPAAVICDTRANTAPRFRQPPMLNITFNKLSRNSAEDVRARDVGPTYTQRHHILQLITEAISATRLIERRARPYSARKRLVWKPAVKQNI